MTEEPQAGESPPAISQSAHALRLLVLLGLGIGAAYIVARLLWPFLPGIVTAAVLAALFLPVQRQIEHAIPQKTVAALAGTTILFFLILAPMVGITFVLAREILASLQWLGEGAAEALAPQGRFTRWLEALAGSLGLDAAQVQETFRAQSRLLAGQLAGRMVGVLQGLGGWLLQASIALFTLYYMLRDGERVVAGIKWFFPLRAHDTDHLVARALEVTYATVYGSVAVAIAQGVIGGLAFWVLGLPSAVLWGTVMAVMSLLPAIGPFIVWVPAAFYLIVTGSVVRGIILIAFGALVISSIDNLLRAILVSGRAELHPLIVFFSVLGGLFVFGAAGIFLGPVLFVLSLALMEMARLALEPEAAARHALRSSLPLTTTRPPFTRRGEP